MEYERHHLICFQCGRYEHWLEIRQASSSVNTEVGNATMELEPMAPTKLEKPASPYGMDVSELSLTEDT